MTARERELEGPGEPSLALAAALGPEQTDRIVLTGVRAHGPHGVLPEEKRDGHEFVVDVALDVQLRRAGEADALARTVNYAEVAQIVVDVVGAPSVDLIETLAERIAQRVLAEHPLVRGVEATIHKPTAPIPHPFADVAVTVARAAAPVDAVLALGSNIGDARGHLERAIALLRSADGVVIDWVAPVFRTAPVGGVEQDDFLNTAVGVSTMRGPWGLLDLAHAIEADARRERIVRWGPRTLDVDVIAYGDLVQDDPDLTVPHPRAHERAFVLAPWASERPDAVLPGHGPIGPLLAQAEDRDGVHRLDGRARDPGGDEDRGAAVSEEPRRR